MVAELILTLFVTIGQTSSDEASVDLLALPLTGSESATTVQILTAELLDTDEPSTRRQHAAFLLARMGEDAKSAVPYLADIAEDEPDSRRWALKALTLFGRHAGPAVPTLMRLASGPQESMDVQLLASEAMANSVADHSEVVGWFYDTLRSPDLTVEQQRGFVSMARVLGPAGGPLTPTLLQYLEVDDFLTRFAAVESLGLIGSPLAIDSLLLASFDNDDPIIADAAAISLNQTAGPIEDAFTKLIDLGDAETRERAARFWTRRSSARSAALKQLLMDESEPVQIAAAEALLSTERAVGVAALNRLSEGTSREARNARKILKGLEIGRARPPACRPGTL